MLCRATSFIIVYTTKKKLYCNGQPKILIDKMKIDTCETRKKIDAKRLKFVIG